MSTQIRPFITPEEYLEMERKAGHKSEYYNGEIFAKSGASRKHNSIAMHLYGIVDRHLRGKSCRAFPSDMRVLLPSGLYTYPDLSATCEEASYTDANVDTLLNPSLIVEILSPSTARYDRGEKAKLYREIPSLKELALIAQDEFDIELYRRQEDGTWILFHAVGLESQVELASVGCVLLLAEIYENID